MTSRGRSNAFTRGCVRVSRSLSLVWRAFRLVSRPLRWVSRTLRVVGRSLRMIRRPLLLIRPTLRTIPNRRRSPIIGTACPAHSDVRGDSSRIMCSHTPIQIPRRPCPCQACIMLPLLFLSRVDPTITVVYTGFSTDGMMFFVGLITNNKKALVVFLLGKVAFI
ncbi:hypothetical protein K443DRAFT_538456, partial [Laccaria amethystina LaAM-08-1]